MSEYERRKSIHLIIPPSWRRMANKCGNCHWLVTEEGKPYYCALRDLYTFRDKLDEACEEYVEGDKNED